MRRLLLLLILLLTFHTIPVSGEVPAPFSDVKPDSDHYVAITYLQEHGIINGYEDGTFRAYEKVNRAEALKMLTLASGLFNEQSAQAVEEIPFSDTPLDAWFTPYLAAAKQAGVIDGYEDGSYKPNQTVNLAEALKIYLNCFENLILPPSTENYLFADTPADAWFTPYTAYGAQWTLLNVNIENKVFPEQEMTRGYLAEIIYRKTLAGEKGLEFGKATFYGAAVQGSNTASGKTFDKDSFTAAHRTLPFGTMVRVTNLANGKTVDVEITDRGPHGPGRILDLSSGAFKEISDLWRGVIYVQYEVLPTTE